MSTFYGIHGTLRLKYDDVGLAAVKDVVDEISEGAGYPDVEFEDNGDGSGSIEFSGGEHMSATTACKIDEAIQELAPYLVEPCFLGYEYEGNPGRMYVGPPELRAVTESKAALDDIRELLPKLKDKERMALLRLLHQS